jgi:pyruvate dehydrogenase E2 component (dihydrolipoamide acetyltransferase)
MAVPVLMPRQGQSVETCILGQWYKSVGEEVTVGDILFSYETDKASFEEEAKEDGVLLATFFNEGDEVPVLVNVAVIGKKDESFEEFKPGGAPVKELIELRKLQKLRQKLLNLKWNLIWTTHESVFRHWQKRWLKNLV